MLYFNYKMTEFLCQKLISYKKEDFLKFKFHNIKDVRKFFYSLHLGIKQILKTVGKNLD